MISRGAEMRLFTESMLSLCTGELQAVGSKKLISVCIMKLLADCEKLTESHSVVSKHRCSLVESLGHAVHISLYLKCNSTTGLLTRIHALKQTHTHTKCYVHTDAALRRPQ